MAGYLLDRPCIAQSWEIRLKPLKQRINMFESDVDPGCHCTKSLVEVVFARPWVVGRQCD